MKKVTKINDRTSSLTYLLFTVPAMLLYIYFYVFSVFKGFGYSLTDWNGIAREKNFIGLENYRQLMSNNRFIVALLRTGKYAIVYVVIVVVLSLILALTLNSLTRFKDFFRSYFFFPAMISSVAVTLTWDQMFTRAIPYLGSLLGLESFMKNPLGSPKTAIYAVMFIHVWQAVAMPTIIFLAGLQSIPDEMLEAARIDGANRKNLFSHIIIPYIIPIITVNVVLQLKSGITMFDYAYALVQGGPARSTELVSVLIMSDAFGNLRFSLANAQAFVLFLLIAVLSTIQIKITENRGVTNL